MQQHFFKTAGEVVFGSRNRTCRLGGSYVLNSGKVFVKRNTEGMKSSEWIVLKTREVMACVLMTAEEHARAVGGCCMC